MQKRDNDYFSICSRYFEARGIKEPILKRIEYAFVVFNLKIRHKEQDNLPMFNLPEPREVLNFSDNKMKELEKTLSENYFTDL